MNMRLGLWNRAIGGRLLHFVLQGKALCGAAPKYWHGGQVREIIHYSRCRKCKDVYVERLRRTGIKVKVTIELSTDEIKALIAWYRMRQTMPDLADFASTALRDGITERLLEAALATRGKEITKEKLNA